MMEKRPSLQKVKEIAEKAGQFILDVYTSDDFDVQIKKDRSPLTRADSSSNAYIVKKLQEIAPNIPVIAEESRVLPYEERKHWKQFWLVDPLDGTKEFIKKNGEFTVNIALIENGKSVMGVIHAPDREETYFAEEEKGCWKAEANKAPVQVFANQKTLGDELRVMISRSHGAPIPEELQKKIKIKEMVSVGSSLKFCYLAEGKADLYARFSPCMEWDVAAGDCLFQCSRDKNLQKSFFHYNSESLRIDQFVIGVPPLENN